MVRFLLIFISIYGLMNAFVLSRIRVLLPDRSGSTVFLACFLVIVVMAPIGARLFETSGHLMLAKLIAHIGYPWMGFVFLSFWAFLLREVLALIGRRFPMTVAMSNPTLTGKGSTALVLGMVTLVCLYGCIEAWGIRTERVAVSTAKLPPGVDRLRIAQISDVHLGLLVGEERLKRILGIVVEEKPDLLVCTGDLVDGNLADSEEIFQLFQAVRAPLGKYAVVGNHEFYVGLSRSLESMERAGFRTLRGESVNMNGTLNIVGVDDPAAGALADEVALLDSVRNGQFVLLLKHRPEVLQRSQGLFDLQLSGHTHLGQIFPFRFFTGVYYPMQNGFYNLENGSRLYTSRGSGTWGPPMRVLSAPEVTIIDLLNPNSPPPSPSQQ